MKTVIVVILLLLALPNYAVPAAARVTAAPTTSSPEREDDVEVWNNWKGNDVNYCKLLEELAKCWLKRKRSDAVERTTPIPTTTTQEPI